MGTGRKSLLIFLAILSWSSAYGIEPVAVRIDSRVCDTKRGLTSSGVPVEFRGKRYVLTSAWGILEETSAICHEVHDPRTNRLSNARLAALDFALGYALLETPEILPLLSLDDSLSDLPSSGQLNVHGFSQDGIPAIAKARIVASKSSRHHLPGLPFSFEIISEKVTNTFVGAPVFGKTLDGIVSSQWIDIVPGSRARVREWKSQEPETPNHLIVIPLALVRKSLESGLLPRSMFQPLSAKLGERTELFFGNFHIGLSCPEGAGEPPHDGIGPIGGADGVGVGGTMKGAETCTARLTRQSEIVLTSPKEIPELLIQELDKYLADGNALLIPFLSTRNVGDNIVRVPFFSLPHLLHEIIKEKRNWVLVKEKAEPIVGDTAFDRLMAENARFKTLLERSYDLIATREDDRGDYRYLYTHSVILGSINWRLVLWRDWFGLLSKTASRDFVNGVMWEGKPLQPVLRESADRMHQLSHRIRGDK